MSDTWDAFPESPTRTPEGRTRVPISMAHSPGKDSWDAFPEAPASPSVAGDIVKSAAIAVPQAAIGIAGMPGDISNLLAKGSQAATDFIAEKIGIDPGPRAAEPVLPTASSLTKRAEDVTGDFYEPKTTPGHYANTITQFGVNALAGPGSLARKILLQGAVPGAASEMAGQATAGTSLEPYARAAAGIAGGLGGAALSRPATAVEAIRKQLPNLPAGAIDDARNLMQVAKSKGIDLTWPEALSQVSGKPVLTDTQRILESAPGSRTRMQDFYSDRPQQFDQAALNEFGQVAPGTRTPSGIGPQVGEAAQSELGGVRKAINTASQPYYDAAETVLLHPEEMKAVKAIPGYRQARNAVRNNPQLNWRVKDLPDNSVGFLNEVKKVFDQAAENAGSKFNPAKNHQVQASNEMAASALKEIGVAKSAEYEIALGIQRDARKQYLEPLLQGPLGRLAKKDIKIGRAHV